MQIEEVEGVTRVGDALVIKRRWAQPADLITLVCIALADTLGLSLLYASGQLFWALVATVVAALATYAIVCRLINWTVIVVADGRIEIEAKPLPWHGDRSISSSEIRQLRTSAIPIKWGSGGLQRHVVVVDTGDGPTQIFSRDDIEPDAALAVKQAVEELLESYSKM